MLELVPEGLLAETLSQILVGAVCHRIVVSLSVGLQITLASIYRGFDRVHIIVICAQLLQFFVPRGLKDVQAFPRGG
jgi:hypothetical protein